MHFDQRDFSDEATESDSDSSSGAAPIEVSPCYLPSCASVAGSNREDEGETRVDELVEVFERDWTAPIALHYDISDQAPAKK